ncbi:unnamed protein product, partial [Mesorhabditis belari]|uniref:Uncharacterized protein n=1 Tax=Mesorhabditis belari TaxID=2138241 RepID=A0AAF3JAG2_9BILA
MRLLLCLFFVIFQIQLCLADPVTYLIDPNNPSFLFNGNDHSDQTTAIILASNLSLPIQVNAYFSDFSNTKFAIAGPGGAKYTQAALQQPTSNIRLKPPLTLTFTQNTSMEFYLTFALYPTDTDSDSSNGPYYLGYDRYSIDVYNGEEPQTYSMVQSKESGTMLTIDEGCSLRIHAGAAPADRSDKYMIGDYRGSRKQPNGWALPTLSAAYYTFTIPQYCGAKFDLIEHTEGTRQIEFSTPDDGYWIRGTMASCDYPGGTFSRKEPVNPMIQRFHVVGQSPAPINVWPNWNDKPGRNGFWSLEIYENDQLVASKNQTTSQSEGWLHATGHDLLVTWVPGDQQSEGIFVRFYYDSPITIYLDVHNDPLVFHTAYWQFTQSGFMIQAPGSFIHVNAMQLTQTRAIYFWDKTQNYSLPQIMEKPRLFKDFVQTSQLDSWYDRFVATFTKVDVNDTALFDSMGLSDYRFWFTNGFFLERPVTMRFDAKNHSQALTVVAPRGGAVINSVLKSNSCEVPLYVSGIPYEELKQKMLIYTFNDQNAATFAPSHIVSPAATFVVPANCQFSFTLQSSNDPYRRELFDGSNGFIYSQEYPANYDNYYSIWSPDDATDYQLYQSPSLGAANANFSIDIVSADPGVNGSLAFTFGKTGKPQETIGITNLTKNWTIQSDGTMVQIEWNDTSTQSGFLLRYRMKAAQLTTIDGIIDPLIDWVKQPNLKVPSRIDNVKQCIAKAAEYFFDFKEETPFDEKARKRLTELKLAQVTQLEQ